MPKVSKSALDPCVGPEPGKQCLSGRGHRPDPAVKGYDDKWRCMPCNKVHGELVFKEAGDSAPLPGDTVPMIGVDPNQTTEMTRRMDVLSATRARGLALGGSAEAGAPMIVGDDGQPMMSEAMRKQALAEDNARVRAMTQKRKDILEKYGAKPSGFDRPKE